MRAKLRRNKSLFDLHGIVFSLYSFRYFGNVLLSNFPCTFLIKERKPSRTGRRKYMDEINFTRGFLKLFFTFFIKYGFYRIWAILSNTCVASVYFAIAWKIHFKIKLQFLIVIKRILLQIPMYSLGQIFEMEILMDLYVLRSHESENPIFSCCFECVCVCVCVC